MAQFIWQYMGIPMSATVDGAISVKHGIRTLTANTQEITGFYVDAGGQNTQYAYEQLIVAHRSPGDPKTKALRAYASAHQPQFKAFIEAIAAAKPQADLRSLPRAEAFKQLGVADSQKAAIIGVPVFVVAVMLIISAPFGIHAFDNGQQRVAAEELGKKPLSSRNLVLSGELETRNYLEITHTKNGAKTSANYLFPVYPAGAGDDAFIPVVLKTNEISSTQMRTLANATEWKCTLRNVWWEGLDGDDRDYFHDTLKLNVTKDTLMCEYSEKMSTDMLAFAMINGITLLAMVGISLRLWFKRSK
jgi:hypothetical protein